MKVNRRKETISFVTTTSSLAGVPVLGNLVTTIDTKDPRLREALEELGFVHNDSRLPEIIELEAQLRSSEYWVGDLNNTNGNYSESMSKARNKAKEIDEKIKEINTIIGDIVRTLDI